MCNLRTSSLPTSLITFLFFYQHPQLPSKPLSSILAHSWRRFIAKFHSLIQISKSGCFIWTRIPLPWKPHDTLIVHEFHGEIRPKYVAISYTWGAAVPLLPLIVNGHTVLVWLNCWYALFQMRHHGYHEKIWLDSLCINQSGDDNSEKNHQVTMIGKLMRILFIHPPLP